MPLRELGAGYKPSFCAEFFFLKFIHIFVFPITEASAKWHNTTHHICWVHHQSVKPFASHQCVNKILHDIVTLSTSLLIIRHVRRTGKQPEKKLFNLFDWSEGTVHAQHFGCFTVQQKHLTAVISKACNTASLCFLPSLVSHLFVSNFSHLHNWCVEMTRM